MLFSLEIFENSSDGKIMLLFESSRTYANLSISLSCNSFSKILQTDEYGVAQASLNTEEAAIIRRLQRKQIPILVDRCLSSRFITSTSTIKY